MFILEALYFFLPAYLANMAPVFAAKVFKNFDKPLDFGMQLGGKPVFGKNKTWRGMFAGIVIAIATVYMQSWLVNYEFFQSISILDYSNYNLETVGFLFGAGALIGDAIKSFFKRRVGIASGEKWFGFDQLDFVVGGLIFISAVYVPESKYIITLLVVSPILHVATNMIGFKLGLKKVPW